ncbi:uncharacterized protein SPPG_00998 [Spizellomyces punctatus DAOM BR117]|uniref:Zn(2)-C6 fungal-type domain-containing protein n=1 Tax=Spizellomyces punctatus (strain DAOM BR117) TaxID=645134 RepID=A0A0L0HR03_SPIPD|nr:uncharacterized protein SPPG_00998 [Spizellomyces punctatus DAOM BR117]KND03517.1 hypothetical protein SPPG_00998 [Spizellomyces punctatus DAOM BR117]|eukprot:XP_016611556.1 hypothetical protein SPPG_00998 [Spizellomyces punctatus DAOM BR117]
MCPPQGTSSKRSPTIPLIPIGDRRLGCGNPQGLPSNVAREYLQQHHDFTDDLLSLPGMVQIEDLDAMFREMVDMGKFEEGLGFEETVVVEVEDERKRQSGPVIHREGESRASGAGKVKKKTAALRKKVDAARKTVEGCPVGIDGNPVTTRVEQQVQQQQQQLIFQAQAQSAGECLLLGSLPGIDRPPSSVTSTGTTASGEEIVRKDCKRRKVCQACILCRKAHMSCDEARPCGRCVRKGMAHLCMDAPKRGELPKPCNTCPVTIRPAPVKSRSTEFKLAPRLVSGPLAAIGLTPPLTIETVGGALMSASAGSAPSTPLAGDMLPVSATTESPSITTTTSGNTITSSTALSSLQPFASQQLSFVGLLNGKDIVPPTPAPSTSTSLNSNVAFNGTASFNPSIQQPFTALAEATFKTPLPSANLSALPPGLLSFASHSTTVPPPRQSPVFDEHVIPKREITPSSPYQSHPSFSPNPGSRSVTPGTPNSTHTSLAPSTITNDTPPPPSTSSKHQQQQQQLGSGPQQAQPCANFVYSAPSFPQPPNNFFASASVGSEFAALAELWSAVSATTGDELPTSSAPHACTGKGSSRCMTCPFTTLEKFYLTAAGDQPSNLFQASDRLAHVLDAKRSAGLLNPHDYTTGYARLGHHLSTQCTAMSRQRILSVVSAFQTGFAALARTVTDAELLASEEIFERLCLEYDLAFSIQGVPSALWRRTGEIVRANQSFADLVGLPLSILSEGKVCVYELLNEESGVNYWERFGRVAFDPEEKGWMGLATLRKSRGIVNEQEIKCAYSVTVRRDNVGVPLVCAGNFLRSERVESACDVIPDWVREGCEVAERARKKASQKEGNVPAASIAAPPVAPFVPSTPHPPLGTPQPESTVSADIENLVGIVGGPGGMEGDMLRRMLEDLLGVART